MARRFGGVASASASKGRTALDRRLTREGGRRRMRRSVVVAAAVAAAVAVVLVVVVFFTRCQLQGARSKWLRKCQDEISCLRSST
eukprot:7159143-Pyramimonas_sp.AAC.1